MAKTFRVIDTEIRDGRRQIAFDQAMIEAHKTGRIPDSIRFLRFPRTALIGRHQALSREIKLDYCRANGIGVVRRITGGGALFFDEGQLGWELVFHRATLGIAGLGELARAICEAAAVGLSKLGVNAKYRPRSDIEVDGRKIGGTGGFFDADTLFYQGTVLVDMNPADMIAALKVPEAKLAQRALDSAAQRVVTLKELLGVAPSIAAIQDALLAGFAERLDIELVRGQITAAEEALAAKYHDEEIGTDAFVAEIDDPGAGEGVHEASHAGAGGTITAYVRLEGQRDDRIREVLVTGDFFVTPPRTILDLEAALRGVAVTDVRTAIERFFAASQVGLMTVSPADFSAAIEGAIGAAHPQ
jgi:lipoate-protein ligase A